MALAAEIKVLKTADVLKAMKIAPAAFERELADAFDHMKRKFFKTWAARTRVKFTPRVGLLDRFIGLIDRVSGKPEKLRLRMFTFSKVAKLHEEGGIVRGKGTRLRIPIPGTSVTTRKGRLKKSFRGRNFREDKRFFAIPGRDIMVRRFRGKNARIEPVFALKERIRITPKLLFGDTWDSLLSFRNARVSLAASRAIRTMARAKAAA